MKVKVILQKDWPNLGKQGEVKIVKMGFAKNFLIPQKIAILGTPQNLKKWEATQIKLQEEAEKSLEQLRKLAQAINNHKLILQKEVKEDGNLFAEVRKLEIINALKEQIPALKNVELSKEQIDLKEKIKKTGTFEIIFKPHKNIEAHLQLLIEAHKKAKQATKTTKSSQKKPSAKNNYF